MSFERAGLYGRGLIVCFVGMDRMVLVTATISMLLSDLLGCFLLFLCFLKRLAMAWLVVMVREEEEGRRGRSGPIGLI